MTAKRPERTDTCPHYISLSLSSLLRGWQKLTHSSFIQSSSHCSSVFFCIELCSFHGKVHRRKREWVSKRSQKMELSFLFIAREKISRFYLSFVPLLTYSTYCAYSLVLINKIAISPGSHIHLENWLIERTYRLHTTCSCSQLLTFWYTVHTCAYVIWR